MEVVTILRVSLPPRTVRQMLLQFPDSRVEASWEEGDEEGAGRKSNDDGMNLLLAEGERVSDVVAESVIAIQQESGVLASVIEEALKLEIDIGVIVGPADVNVSVSIDAAMQAYLSAKRIDLCVSFYSSED